MEFANSKGRGEKRAWFKGGLKGLRPVRFSSSYLLISIIAVASITACAPKKEPDLFWPLPPDEPRIKFLYSFSSLGELAKKGLGSSFTGIILGEQLGAGGNFLKPYGIHIDKEGNIYVTDTGRGTVELFDIKKNTVINMGGEGRYTVKPVGVTSDSSGRIYVTDTYQDRIFVFDREGKLVTIFGFDEKVDEQDRTRKELLNRGKGITKPEDIERYKLIRPSGIAINDELKRLYVVDVRQHQVVVVNSETGEHVLDIGKRGKEGGALNFPTNITVDQKGNLYITDYQGRVQIFGSDGQFIKVFGKIGDQPGMFARPKGIGIDSEGHIYVADAAFNNVQIFDSEGRILMHFGGPGNGRGEMVLPAGLAIDSEDKIYITDQLNQRVNVFQYMGEKYKASRKK